MKLRNKLALVSSLASLSLVGTGFAAWAFTKSVNDSATTTAKATAAIEASGLSVKDASGNDVGALYLICDAPSGQAGLVAGNGIYWSTEDSNDHSKAITTLRLVGSVTEHDEDIVDFSTYVGHFASTATSAIDGEYVDIPATSALDVTVASESKNGDVEYVWTLPVPAYDSIPTNVAEVDLLKAEVGAIDLSFGFTFNVVSVA